MSKRVIISVISDLVTDQRVHRTALTLHNKGFNVLLIGRKLPDSLPVGQRDYSVQRFNLLFNKGPLFYINYNLRLFFFLLFNKVDLLWSNDLDTLLPNYLISKIRRKQLVYDSHEYFTGVPELVSRPLVQGIWKKIEHFIFPKLKYVFTVNESIANLYQEKYGVEVKVIRNVPLLQEEKINQQELLRSTLGLPAEKFIFILQGSGLNVDRGCEEAVLAMQYLDDCLLLIIGGGDVITQLKMMVKKNSLEERVFFKPKMKHDELKKFTSAADVGLSLDKDSNLNYRFSLPNKLFDYIHSGIPVLVSDLPEVKKIVNHYQIGLIAYSHDPKQLALTMSMMHNDKTQLLKWKDNCAIAAKELNWQNEQKIIIDLIHHLK